MKLAASYAISSLVSEEQLKNLTIIPNALDNRVAYFVAKTVMKKWWTIKTMIKNLI